MEEKLVSSWLIKLKIIAGFSEKMNKHMLRILI